MTRYKLSNNEEKTRNKEISVQDATEMSNTPGHFIHENFKPFPPPPYMNNNKDIHP